MQTGRSIHKYLGVPVEAKRRVKEMDTLERKKSGIVGPTDPGNPVI